MPTCRSNSASTLRNPAFPDRPITLRMLLSHTSSLTDGAGYWNVPLGSAITSITNDPKAWDDAHPPGTYFRYTNLNFPLVAQLMERATGERFDLLMRRLVLAPLKLDACFNWSGCSDAAIDRAVVLYDADGAPQKDDLHGKRPDCPVIVSEGDDCDLARATPGTNGALFSPQGGLRISVRDLATIGRMLLNDGSLDGVRILKPSSVRILATPVWTSNGHNGEMGEEDEPSRGGFFCRYGLAMEFLASGNGTTCRDDLFGDGRKRIGHSGNAYGLLSGLWIDRERGTGVAYFATGVGTPAQGEHSAFDLIEEQAARGASHRSLTLWTNFRHSKPARKPCRRCVRRRASTPHQDDGVDVASTRLRPASAQARAPMPSVMLKVLIY